jgi:hypothetical protein
MKTSKHPKLANGQPAISCFGLSSSLLDQRSTRAQGRLDKQIKEIPKGLPENEFIMECAAVMRSILWHDDFVHGLKFLVCDKLLYRVTADLPSQLEEANDNEPLDFWDYGYVADMLRELLRQLDTPKGDRQNLRRALAWVEERGSGLRNYSQE